MGHVTLVKMKTASMSFMCVTDRTVGSVKLVCHESGYVVILSGRYGLISVQVLSVEIWCSDLFRMRPSVNGVTTTHSYLHRICLDADGFRLIASTKTKAMSLITFKSLPFPPTPLKATNIMLHYTHRKYHYPTSTNRPFKWDKLARMQRQMQMTTILSD